MTRGEIVRLALKIAIDTTEASIQAHHRWGKPMPEWKEQIARDRKLLTAFEKELVRRMEGTGQ